MLVNNDLPNVTYDECGHGIYCGCDNGFDHEYNLYETYFRLEIQCQRQGCVAKIDPQRHKVNDDNCRFHL
ncbi:hypothetical protein EJ02DRAFT_459821 [Clathrospora elynae]|uniref:Uncharacterized protein n=1 Tax=Clathrospora elynae TaxID=706981 RepID=A0A6A5S886_9PLEO|nr:hypothetical protein EJ02DRAFT_459821 [Clathrospora elynae]